MNSATINLELDAHYPAVLFHFFHMSKKSNINAITFQEEINGSASTFKKATITITMPDDQSNNSGKITGKQLTLEPRHQIIQRNLRSMEEGCSVSL